MPLPKCVRVLEDDTQSREALEADGWRYVETLVEMKRATEAMPWNGKTYVHQGGRDDLVKLALSNMGPNRFMADGKPAMALEAREQWIRDFKGDIIVCRNGEKGGLTGFLMRDRNRIVLMAAKGDGPVLVNQFITDVHLRGWDEAFLGTQETNHDALRLYGRLGFRTYCRRVTYHKD